MARMTAPPSGVKVRMYRQGHGDCFLLAFTGREARRKRAVYVLIDCGLKPGSEVGGQKIETIIDDIHAATGGHVDIVIVTHEHEDHVNGFGRTRNGAHLFDKISFGQCWLGWTEDGTDELANALRARFQDTLMTLAFTQERLGAQATPGRLATRLSDLIGTETGETAPAGTEGAALIAAFRDAKNRNPLMGAAELARTAIRESPNKRAMKYLRDRARMPTTFLSPDRPPVSLPHVEGLRVYTLGPPRNVDLLLDLEPTGGEEFSLSLRRRIGLDGAAFSFAQAVAPDILTEGGSSPFSRRHRIAAADILSRAPAAAPGPDSPDSPLRDLQLDYLRRSYGGTDPEVTDPDIAWRRIDDDWLGSAESLALRLNSEVNNTSLVLAFELPRTGKVLLFTGDAQRGSWIGWSDLSWTDGKDKTTTARDLLARTVLYKVGHHGSHNATLNGSEADSYANLGWMARGAFAGDFAAMIPANTEWALNKAQPWAHPLPQIETALHAKARGRVFRSDRDHVTRAPDAGMTDADWRDFTARTREKPLYFEYVITDKP